MNNPEQAAVAKELRDTFEKLTLLITKIKPQYLAEAYTKSEITARMDSALNIRQEYAEYLLKAHEQVATALNETDLCRGRIDQLCVALDKFNRHGKELEKTLNSEGFVRAMINLAALDKMMRTGFLEKVCKLARPEAASTIQQPEGPL